jgi:abortive infection bacteriophage resistance protein
MPELKAHQPPMTVDGQIKNLREKGLMIENEDYARSFLNDVSYFRLIKAYSLGLKVKNGNYNGDVRFEDAVNLYLFNSNFRQQLFVEIEKVEVNLRCRLSNYFCEKYGVLGYEDVNNFAVPAYHGNFLDEVQREIARNAKAPFVKNFRVFATLLTLKYLLPNDRHWSDFIQAIEILIEKYPNVNLRLIGFPQDWSDKLMT